MHLTHPKLVRNSGQPQCSAQGPTPVLMPVPWSRGNDRSIECMSFDVGGNRSTRRKPTQTRGEHANSTQKGRDSNPGPSCCEATALTTAPPCCPYSSQVLHVKNFTARLYAVQCTCRLCHVCLHALYTYSNYGARLYYSFNVCASASASDIGARYRCQCISSVMRRMPVSSRIIFGTAVFFLNAEIRRSAEKLHA